MIQFTKPLYLLLLIPLGYYTYRLSKHTLADLSGFRAKAAILLRTIILLLLVFSLAGARMVRNVPHQCVIFVIDVSDSIAKSKQEAALAYVNDALRTIKKEQKAGLIVFGGDASVELAPSCVNKIEELYSMPDRSETNICQALALALASFPERHAKKIVLLSDGNETSGKAMEQALLASSDNVSINVVPLRNEQPCEALLEKMICPSKAKIGEPFELKILAVSKEPTTARIRLLRNGEPADVKSVVLSKGKNMLTFRQSAPKAGSYEFKAVLECERDARPENNLALGYTMVAGKPRVLYVEGQRGQAKYLSQALKSSDIEVEPRDRSGVPNSLAQLRGYDMLVLSDVPAWNLAPDQMTMIQSAVKDLGIGFTMIGGENSFGVGGYYDTPIEEALPVNMSITKTKVMPSLSVAIVMDKSGSMAANEGGRQKIELANDAAAAAVSLLQPIDYVGIVVCHSRPVVAVPLQEARSKGPIYDQISTIRAEGGGISVFPSMSVAHQMISSSKTRLKHVILLADGADCDDQQGVIPLVKKMASERITVSAVAIGDGKDVPFLKATAYVGKGNFYMAERARDLKAIFTKDVMTASKSLVIEEPFVPRMDPSSPELRGIDANGVPPLLGYVATTPKPTARVAATSHKNDPILATWRYGLGRSAAFTSDCKARWSSRWLEWPDYNKFWAQVLRSTVRKSISENFQTTVNVTDRTARVVIDAVDDKGNFLNFLEFSGSVVAPDFKGHPMNITQTGPGRYESKFEVSEVGSYVVNVRRKDQKQTGSDVNVISIPYPPEYKDIAPSTALLRRLTLETSGKFAPKASEVFSHGFRRTEAYTDLWRLFALLAVFILPADVAVRRLALSLHQLAEAFDRVRERIHALRKRVRAPTVRQPTETVEALLRVKKQHAASSVKSPEPVKQPDTGVVTPVQKIPSAPSGTQPAEADESAHEADSDTGTTSRLLEAKRRAQEKND